MRNRISLPQATQQTPRGLLRTRQPRSPSASVRCWQNRQRLKTTVLRGLAQIVGGVLGAEGDAIKFLESCAGTTYNRAVALTRFLAPVPAPSCCPRLPLVMVRFKSKALFRSAMRLFISSENRVTAWLDVQSRNLQFDTHTRTVPQRDLFFYLDIGEITTLSKNWARASQLARCTLGQAQVQHTIVVPAQITPP